MLTQDIALGESQTVIFDKVITNNVRSPEGLPEGDLTFRGETNRRVTLQQGVIIGILYRIFLHQTPSNRTTAALRKYSI
jgi:hypothetical protein